MATSLETELRMETTDLYREEVFTDRKVGTIRQLTPVLASGAPDAARPTRFMGETQILTQGGLLPLHFEIEATSLQEAVQKFGPSAQVALEDTVREIQAMRREQASQLVIPDPGTASQLLGPGGAPAGPGKIRLR